MEGLSHGLWRRGSQITTGSELGLYVQQRVQTYPHSRQTPDFGTFAFDDRGEMLIPLAAKRWVAPLGDEPTAAQSATTLQETNDPRASQRTRYVVLGTVLLVGAIIMVVAVAFISFNRAGGSVDSLGAAQRVPRAAGEPTPPNAAVDATVVTPTLEPSRDTEAAIGSPRAAKRMRSDELPPPSAKSRMVPTTTERTVMVKAADATSTMTYSPNANGKAQTTTTPELAPEPVSPRAPVTTPAGSAAAPAPPMAQSEPASWLALPVAPLQMVAPSVLEANRIAGEKVIIPDQTTQGEISGSGMDTIIGAFKLCITVDGSITIVATLKSTGSPAYDTKIQETIHNTWRYRPFMVKGQPTPVCTSVRVIYSQQ